MKSKIKLQITHQDLSNIKPPTHPAIETMLENLHNAGRRHSK